MKQVQSTMLGIDVQYEARHLGTSADDNGWEHDAWSITLNGQTISYRTGLGHRKKRNNYSKAVPVVCKVDDVLYSLVIDSYASEVSYDDWCSDFGYDTDSRKALEIYLACQESAMKLRNMKLGKSLSELQELFSEY